MGRARVELLSSSSFSDLRADRLHHRPMYGSLPICHNDFMMNVLVEKPLLKLLSRCSRIRTYVFCSLAKIQILPLPREVVTHIHIEGRTGFEPAYKNTDFADRGLTIHTTYPNLKIYHYISFYHCR